MADSSVQLTVRERRMLTSLWTLTPVILHTPGCATRRFCARRDLKGSLSVDRAAGTLELDVEPPATASQQGGGDAARSKVGCD